MSDNNALQAARIAALKRRLAADPASRSFLELAREYHEAGLFEEAGAVCTQGLKYHPHYVSARVLLGRICFDRGLMDDARGHMEMVLSAVPDNLVARRVVADICLVGGDLSGALERFRALLAFNPGDQETKSRIEEIERTLGAPSPTPAQAAAPAESAESRPTATQPPPRPQPSPLATIDDSQPILELVPPAAAAEPVPLATPTLAEIYLQQGLTEKAIEVYREILKGDPENVEAVWRLSELAPAPAVSPDPAAILAARKVEALSGWLAAIRRGARA